MRELTRSWAKAGAGWRVGLTGVVALVAGVGALAGCSAAAAGATGTSCGTTRTAANVLVNIEVTKGTVDCASVLAAEKGYATMLSEGRVRGNGGGAPVTVDGWTCMGYLTPVALRTGDVSECHTGTAEVVAVLVLPSSSPTA
jgi:hypothetical protein